MPENERNGLLDVRGVASCLNVSPRTVWSMTAAGKFPAAIRIGRLARWRRETVDDWIAEKEREAFEEQKRLTKISA